MPLSAIMKVTTRFSQRTHDELLEKCKRLRKKDKQKTTEFCTVQADIWKSQKLKKSRVSVKKSAAFTPWIKWENRNQDPKFDKPGIYAIAIPLSGKDIKDIEDKKGKKFEWEEYIVYFGMTSGKSVSLRSRLNAFNYTIHGGRGHGGAQRFLKDYRCGELRQKLYVSVWPFKRKKDNEVRYTYEAYLKRYEMDCIHEYYKRFKEFPKYNDPESPKLRRRRRSEPTP